MLEHNETLESSPLRSHRMSLEELKLLERGEELQKNKTKNYLFGLGRCLWQLKSQICSSIITGSQQQVFRQVLKPVVGVDHTKPKVPNPINDKNNTGNDHSNMSRMHK